MIKNILHVKSKITTVAFVLIIILLIKKKQKKYKKLVIVGNGFDIYHRIASNYLQFRDYLRKENEEVFDALQEYLYFQGEDHWNHFETNLSNLDSEEFLDDMKIFLTDDFGNNDFEFEVGKILELLGNKMKEHFLDWILQLKLPPLSEKLRLPLPTDAFYLNFNYTNSLETLYSIPTRNIVYIHGKAIDASSQIVLGHGWTEYNKATEPSPITYEDFVDGNYSTEEDWRVTEVKQYIINFFADNYKNAPEIIKKNNKFFNKLKHVEEVFVLGHSMTKVDRKYFDKIARSIDCQKVKWTISYYKDEDINNSTESLKDIGIDMNLVSFKSIKDVFASS